MNNGRLEDGKPAEQAGFVQTQRPIQNNGDIDNLDYSDKLMANGIPQTKD